MATESKGPLVVVVGACFIDESCYMPRAPNRGETLPCSTYQQSFGGKGANQAVMVGKLGGRIRLVATVGNDANGTSYIDNLEQHSVDTTFVRRTATPTGFAHIWVSEETGDNQIVIFQGAAAELVVEKAQALIDEGCLTDASIVICQNEIPLETTVHFLKAAHAMGKVTIFNPAPAVALTKECLELVSVLVVNEHEAAVICGRDTVTAATAAAAALQLRGQGASSVVITLGAAGCILLPKGSDDAMLLPCPTVEKVVDTSGAGDCWVGCLAHFLAQGKDLTEGCRRANIIAALSVAHKGTQISFPAHLHLRQPPTSSSFLSLLLRCRNRFSSLWLPLPPAPCLLPAFVGQR